MRTKMIASDTTPNGIHVTMLERTIENPRQHNPGVTTVSTASDTCQGPQFLALTPRSPDYLEILTLLVLSLPLSVMPQRSHTAAMLLLVLLVPHAAADPVRIAIIGGGIGGTAAAYFLRQLQPSWQIELFEREHIGGR
jgi:2-polyprenyl-6-methoxyphenol hydroxylase-like FAD-dependent oxidoreductase